MRQLLIDASERLIVLVAQSEASGEGGDTGYMTAFYVPKQLVHLNVTDELGGDDVAAVWQGTILKETATAADGGDHAVKEEEELSSKRRLTDELRDGDQIFAEDRGGFSPEL